MAVGKSFSKPHDSSRNLSEGLQEVDQKTYHARRFMSQPGSRSQKFAETTPRDTAHYQNQARAGTSYPGAPPPPAGYPAPPPPAAPVAVVSSQFCAPYFVNLMTLAEGNFRVTDVNGKHMFKVKGKLFSIRDRRVLLDAAGNPLLSFQQKMLTAHRRWKVYRGNSSDEKDFLFSVKKSSLIQFKTKLDVFLASNTKEDVCDFRIEGSWLERSCKIYAGYSNAIVAQMHEKHSVQTILLGKEAFPVTVYPYVDYAFIVALVVILSR